jgi:hypothetical protein
MFKKITHALMALVMAFGFAASSVPDAQAGHRTGRNIAIGAAAGIIGLGILGAAANARGRHHSYSSYDDDGEACYYGPRECHWTSQRCFENRWGDTVCRGGRRICERPLICE